jgi:glucokinase
MLAFAAKGRLQSLLQKIPVKVVTNDRVGLIGAARYAVNNPGRPVEELPRRAV